MGANHSIGGQSDGTGEAGRRQREKLHSSVRMGAKPIKALGRLPGKLVGEVKSGTNGLAGKIGARREAKVVHLTMAEVGEDAKTNGNNRGARTPDESSPMERRKRSLHDGDVFIYPEQYKDMNECQKCSRDNRICNCNLPDDDDDSDTNDNDAKSASGGHFFKAPDTITGKPGQLQPHQAGTGQTGTNYASSTVAASAKSSTLDDRQGCTGDAREADERDQASRSEAEGAGASEAAGESALDAGQRQQQLPMPRKQQRHQDQSQSVKTVYKISIATASIDQKHNNQLRLSSPQIILPKPSSCDATAPPAPAVSANRSPPPAAQRSDEKTGPTKSELRGSPVSWRGAGGQSDGSSRVAEFGSLEGPSGGASRVEAQTAALDQQGAASLRSSPYPTGCAHHSDRPASAVAVTVATATATATKTDNLLLLSAPQKAYRCEQATQMSTSKDNQALQRATSAEAKVSAIVVSTAPLHTDSRPALPESYPSSVVEPDEEEDGQNSGISDLNNNNRTSVCCGPNIVNQCDRRPVANGVLNEEDEDESKQECIQIESSVDQNDTQHFTCNLSLSDSIKITSTSIRIGGRRVSDVEHNMITNSGGADGSHTSIVPIETLSTRRRNLASKLSRQAIREDDCDYDTVQPQCIVLPAPIAIEGSASSPVTDQYKDNEALEYSPILTSVRDYIENVNTELQVQTSVASITELPLLPIIAQPCCLPEIPTKLVVGPLSPLATISEAGVTSVGLAATTAIAATVSVHKAELESPKKSIFEGASKDEILEYLEDARERVPEILMAADDVMVIGENELIVVNQLEPNSPATPISIVEANEVIAEPNARIIPITQGEEDEAEADEQQLQDRQHTENSLANPEQLRQHLQHMYQTSQLMGSQFSSTVSTMDEDTGVLSDRQSGAESKFNSAYNSIDLPLGNSPISGASATSRTGRISDIKSYSSALNSPITLGSVDESGVSMDSPIPIGDNQQGHDDRLSSPSPLTRSGSTRHQSQPRRSTRANHSTSISNQPSNSSADEVHFGPSTILMGRRNSSSEASSQRDRNCALQMMILQQRYTNRDSLGSGSSSPSSASPSSSSSASSTSTSSSNRTSGNCSAASTFYASSSLSCSSPLLIATTLAPSMAPASNQCAPTNSLTLGSSQLDPTNSCYSQLLESLIKSANSSDPMTSGAARGLSGLISPQVERDDSGFGSEMIVRSGMKPVDAGNFLNLQGLGTEIGLERQLAEQQRVISSVNNCLVRLDSEQGGNVKLNVIQEDSKLNRDNTATEGELLTDKQSVLRVVPVLAAPLFKSSANLVSRSSHGHYATMNRLNNYFLNRHPLENGPETTIEFQCLDCDQFIDVNPATMLHKASEFRQFDNASVHGELGRDKLLTPDQLDRAYIAAMNGLPLCKACEKKRIERKEIISEFVETELKYGRDLKIIHDEFYRPMQIAGLLNKDQINGVFLNLEELIMANCRFSDRLEMAISEANSMGDADYNTVNIGKLFVESAEMLHTFESYCIRQGSAACLLARLAKEKELLRIFLRVSQMENTLLRRMNLAAFLMVPVQRVTKYPLLLNRLYKVTAYHHKDREALRDAQLKVELHLEHINQQTKGVGATNKIWRRISNLSAPISHRRGLINAEDIGYIKLRKTAMDMLKWDRDETQFIHSGKLNFVPLNEFIIKQKMKHMRYMAAHALLIVLGKPNWRYRPDLVKSTLDSKLMTPSSGGTGIKEAALLLFREKNGRFIPCRDPLFLSNCILSNDCSQFNSECPLNQPNHHNAKAAPSNGQAASGAPSASGGTNRKFNATLGDARDSSGGESRAASVDSQGPQNGSSTDVPTSTKTTVAARMSDSSDQRNGGSLNGDSVSMSSMKSLPEEHALPVSPPPAHNSRSYSLASALPRTTINTLTTNSSLTKATSSTSSNLTILNQLMTKVNSYHKQSVGQSKPTSTMEHPGKVASIPSNSPTESAVFSSSSKTSNNSAKSNSSDSQSNNRKSSASSSSSIGVISQIIPSSSSPAITISTLTATTASVTTTTTTSNPSMANDVQPHYNHHFFHNHHQPYGDYEESFEIHERLTKESMLLRADTPLKTRYWLQMLRYHAKDLGQWRNRRNGLANIMMMRQE